jgi:hypothetical protein
MRSCLRSRERNGEPKRSPSDGERVLYVFSPCRKAFTGGSCSPRSHLRGDPAGRVPCRAKLCFPAQNPVPLPRSRLAPGLRFCTPRACNLFVSNFRGGAYTQWWTIWNTLFWHGGGIFPPKMAKNRPRRRVSQSAPEGVGVGIGTRHGVWWPPLPGCCRKLGAKWAFPNSGLCGVASGTGTERVHRGFRPGGPGPVGEATWRR